MPPRIVIRDLPDVWRTRIPVGQTGLFASGPIVRLVVHNQGDLGLINLQARLQRIVCLDRPEHEEARIIDYHGAPLRWGGMGEGQPKTLNPDDFGFLELLRSMDMGLLMFENGMVAKEHPDIPPGKYWQVIVKEILSQAEPELHPYSGRFALQFDFEADNHPAQPMEAIITCDPKALVPGIKARERRKG